MKQDLSKLLSKNLKRYRKEVSQNQFCKILGISNASINRIENRDQNVSLKTIQTICTNLNVPVKELFK